ncbi:MAG: hypothetical protein BWY95_00806 [Bacteroidetes bacterium ADurb.BinA104]|nr:MAG: hypothetical protein BWY95_00806 [Bacteroidetes bacterium ADurb.BinA104]
MTSWVVPFISFSFSAADIFSSESFFCEVVSSSLASVLSFVAFVFSFAIPLFNALSPVISPRRPPGFEAPANKLTNGCNLERSRPAIMSRMRSSEVAIESIATAALSKVVVNHSTACCEFWNPMISINIFDTVSASLTPLVTRFPKLSINGSSFPDVASSFMVSVIDFKVGASLSISSPPNISLTFSIAVPNPANIPAGLFPASTAAPA